MSKSKGNIIDPEEMIEKAGVDAIRLQFFTTDIGSQKRFSFNLMKESVSPFLTVLYNCNNYYNQLKEKKGKEKIEDKWILSKLNSTIKEVTEDLEKYSMDEPFRKISDFVVNDFSRGYIKITRDRDDNKKIIGKVLKEISLLLAPFTPYITEYIYQGFSKKSVHLSKWPKADSKKIDKKLENRFELIMKIIETGLAARDKAQIGLKWPLVEATVLGGDFKFKKDEEEVIMNQLNVKSLSYKEIYANTKEISVDLNTNLNPELEAEGYARELSRKVQAFRKKIGFEKKDKIELHVITDENFKKILEKQKSFIKERTNSKKINIVTTSKERFKNKIEFKIKDKRGDIGIILK